MEWGSQVKFLENLQQTMGEVPKALKDKPSLTQWTVGYYRAFSILSDSRPLVQGGLGPIPLSEMLAYMEMFHITDVDERERFVKMIKTLDRVFLKHMMNKMKQDRERQSKKPRQPRKGKRRR